MVTNGSKNLDLDMVTNGSKNLDMVTNGSKNLVPDKKQVLDTRLSVCYNYTMGRIAYMQNRFRKQCKSCGLVRCWSDFRRKESDPTGFSPICTACEHDNTNGQRVADSTRIVGDSR
jgi:hypothetical protein